MGIYIMGKDRGIEKKVYIICPVRHCTYSELQSLNRYVEKLKAENCVVFFPHTDAPQNDTIGYQIVKSEVNAIRNADEVHIFWNKRSKGSHFDLGTAIAFNKKLVLVNDPIDSEEKSYLKVIKEIIKRQ